MVRHSKMTPTRLSGRPTKPVDSGVYTRDVAKGTLRFCDGEREARRLWDEAVADALDWDADEVSPDGEDTMGEQMAAETEG